MSVVAGCILATEIANKWSHHLTQYITISCIYACVCCCLYQSVQLLGDGQMSKRCLLQANDGNRLVNNGEMLVNDGERIVNDGEMSI